MMNENKNPSCPTCESELQEVNAGWYCKRCNVIVVFQDALQARITQWIPVSEPPKESDFYLIRYKGYRVPDTTYYDTEDGWYFEGDSQPDYWMPLPEPPEENE